MTDKKQIAEEPQEVQEPVEQETPSVEEVKPKQSVFDKVEEELVAKEEVVGDNPPGEEPVKEAKAVDKVLVRCPDCPWKAGFKDEYTYCSTCNGAGKVEADPLE